MSFQSLPKMPPTFVTKCLTWLRKIESLPETPKSNSETQFRMLPPFLMFYRRHGKGNELHWWRALSTGASE